MKNKLASRRFFLAQLSSFSLTACQLGALYSRKDILTPRRLILGYKGHLYVYSMNTGRFKDIIIGNDPHSFVPHPHDPNRIWAIGKWQKTAIEVDLNLGRVLRSIYAPQNSVFSGHAVFSKNAESIFLPANNRLRGKGEVLVYNSENGDLSSSLDAGVDSLHDCQLFSDDTLLLTSVGRESSVESRWQRTSVFFIDLSKQKISEQKFINEPDQWITHVTCLGDENYMATSTPYLKITDNSRRAGAAYFGKKTRELLKIVLPPDVANKIKNELLSTSVDMNHNIAVITNPRGGNIIWVDSRTGEYLACDRLFANGVSYISELNCFVFSPFSGGDIYLGHKAKPLHLLKWKTPHPFTFDSGHILVV